MVGLFASQFLSTGSNMHFLGNHSQWINGGLKSYHTTGLTSSTSSQWLIYISHERQREKEDRNRTTSPSVCLHPLCEGERTVILTLYLVLKKTYKKGRWGILSLLPISAIPWLINFSLPATSLWGQNSVWTPKREKDNADFCGYVDSLLNVT